jgi:DNA polymerase-3 subunit epsilon
MTDAPRYAVIDTETSGLFDFSKPANAEGQPRLAELAMIFLDADLAETGQVAFMIKPDGWSLSAEAAKVNGLSHEMLTVYGYPIADVLAAYAAAIDEGRVIVSFNTQFDTKVMRGELRRAGLDDRFEATPNICVMRACAPICRLKKSSGCGFKNPKLSEACAFFDIYYDGSQHRAEVDARCAVELLRRLRDMDMMPEPAVHYARA